MNSYIRSYTDTYVCV